ncbi:hypothetical protein Pcinc_005598 [Petrolisthes cinctipes]|uniref:Uncharacterized protein n=1 Tax=Petrolisthes cinctipes TaxID=88211 RepID=A0AAE1GCB3_PETCI|nr:hypothetical protein Pcinc_005598 [Petrolisthes cinctipes]
MTECVSVNGRAKQETTKGEETCPGSSPSRPPILPRSFYLSLLSPHYRNILHPPPAAPPPPPAGVVPPFQCGYSTPQTQPIKKLISGLGRGREREPDGARGGEEEEM